MKKLFALLVAFALLHSVALADDVVITIKKAGDTKAKVSTFSDDKVVSVVPITFASDASWDSVKDSYTVSSDTVASLSKKKNSISIASDGTATFQKTK